MTLGETYTFYVSVKLTPGSSGTADLTIRSDVAGSDPLYNSLLSSSVTVSDESWTQLSGDYTHDSEPDSFWFYVKGPSAVNEEAASFYIDDFSLVLQGSGPLDFSNSENIVDIGAYEYIDPSLNISTVGSNLLESFIYPNPATNKVTISGINSKTTVIIVDLNGKEYDLSKIIQMEPNSASIDVRSLKSGLYFIKVQGDNESRTFKLLKQ